MVYRFRLISDEVDDFYRDFDIDGDQTFYEFHLAIQNELGYDKTQISSFFLSNQHWEKELEITLMDMADNDKRPTMEKAKISSYIKNEKQRLLYIFDFFYERLFFIEFIGKGEKNDHLPCCVDRRNEPPPQLLKDEESGKKEKIVYLNSNLTKEDIEMKKAKKEMDEFEDDFETTEELEEDFEDMDDFDGFEDIDGLEDIEDEEGEYGYDE